MTARGDAAVQQSARRLLPVNHGTWVLDRARTSLQAGTARLGAREISSLDPERLWTQTDDRGRGRHAHGFTFLADWVGASPQAAPEEQAAISELVHRTVVAWDERFGANRDAAPEMGYHDETTAQRLLGVTAAIDMLELTASQQSDLTEFAGRTAALLAEPDFHSGLNNHGMFQDVALLAWSILVAGADDPAGNRVWASAEERLSAYFDTCFTSEGVHVENTPTYHVMVARYLPVLASIFESAGSATAALYKSLLAGAERYAVHCVTPEGTHPPISDTQRRRLDTELNLSTFTGGEFEFATTRGARGHVPSERTAVFPVSGYAMTRSAWGDEDATFVFFACAYNADYHKHSDESSIFLRSGGRDLLCEAGAYGYNWKDPYTKYAYSSAAHNTMLVAGGGLPRTETEAARGGESQPLDELTIGAAEDDLLDATGTTRRYPERVWNRRLIVTHGDTPVDSHIQVEDEVLSTRESANVRFLWHLGPGLSVVTRPRGAEVFDGTTKVMEIDIRTSADIALSVVEGVEGQHPQGWYHPAFGERVPAPVLTVDCWQKDVSIETAFRLSGFVWGTEERESLRPLLETGPAVPAWSSLGEHPQGSPAIVLLAPHDAPGDRGRLTTELDKGGVPYWYVPGANRDVERAPTPDSGVAAAETIADAVAGLIRREQRRGVDVIIGVVGEAFVPGAIAASTTGASLIGLNPRLPYPHTDTRSQRLAVRLGMLTETGAATRMRFVITEDALRAAESALQFLGSARIERDELRYLLASDAEDGFSDVLRNALEVAAGSEPRYRAGYDRRNRCFVLDLPEQEGVLVAVRVFRGKEEMATTPYRAGSSHRIPYEGSGPHRLRVHVRNDAGDEIFGFTTGVIRVR